MNRRTRSVPLIGALLLAMVAAMPVQAAGPARERDAYTDTFFDDFIFELCGIETFTTLIERWTFKAFEDGSTTLHVVRTFIPDDPRLPIEKGAATSHTAPDGTRVVTGKPTQLFDRQDGGVRLLDAGRSTFDPDGNLIRLSGQSVSLLVDDLAPYYCP